MFGRKKEMQALRERIGELEASLASEMASHQADRQALTSLQERIELEERGFRELRATCQQKLEAMDEEAERFRQQQREVVSKLRERKERQETELMQEAEAARAALKQELNEGRMRSHNETLARLQAFGDNYSYYLSQIKLMMDLLTKAATNTSAMFLTAEDVDLDQIFEAEISASLDQDIFGPSQREGAEDEPE